VTEQPALDFAGLLRQLRMEARLTQEELAEAAGACHCVGQADQAREHWQRALDIYTDLGVPEAASVPTSSPAAVIPAGRAPAESRGGST